MSRSLPAIPPVSRALLFGWAGLWLGTSPAQAESQPETTAENVIASAKQAYGPPPPEPKCDPQQGDEIVVCAEEQEQSQFRVKSSSELDPTGEEAIDDGLPRAPDVAGPGIFKGPATIGGLCVPGLQKCPPPPALLIDFSELPEAPPGSDADRISKGLPPRGNDTGTFVSQETPDEPADEATEGAPPNR